MPDAPDMTDAPVPSPTCSLSVGNPLGRRARLLRAAAGLAFLLIAGALASRQLPGGIDLWPMALIPAWFGISHLIAAMTGYRGCPELGAIPSVLLGHPVGTDCGPLERLDRLVEPRPAAGRGAWCP